MAHRLGRTASLLVAIGIAVSVPATAAAAPSPASLGSTGSVSYSDALFRSGAQVFEFLGVEHYSDSWGPRPQGSVERLFGTSTGAYQHLRRVTEQTYLDHLDTAKVLFTGVALPDEFWVPADLSSARYPRALVNPHPWPYGTWFDSADPPATVFWTPGVSVPGWPPATVAVGVAVDSRLVPNLALS